jgi:hypothetical protein
MVTGGSGCCREHMRVVLGPAGWIVRELLPLSSVGCTCRLVSSALLLAAAARGVPPAAAPAAGSAAGSDAAVGLRGCCKLLVMLSWLLTGWWL